MKFQRLLMLGAACGLLAGCGGKEPGSTQLTRGALRVQADEAILPSVQAECEEFQRQYPDSRIEIQPADARAAISDFALDSIRVIVTGRPLNKEERDALTAARIQFEEYRVALSAVAVIANKENPLSRLRVSELDSILTGEVTQWPGKHGPIDLVIAGRNSSVNEAVRNTVMQGKNFTMAAAPIDSSAARIEYVRTHRGAIGLVGVNWLRRMDKDLTIMALGTPGARPDSTQPPGQYYSPAQAYVYKGWYPIGTPVYVYSREIDRNLALGFISFVTSGPGQKVFLNNGLVPVTMPVRLVQLTSQQVH
jgi:phosphate transport system substrate-binding protein